MSKNKKRADKRIKCTFIESPFFIISPMIEFLIVKKVIEIYKQNYKYSNLFINKWKILSNLALFMQELSCIHVFQVGKKGW